MVKFTLGRGLGLVAKGLAKTGSLSIIGIGKVSAKLIRNEEVSTKIKNISTEMAVKADEMATVVVPKIEEFTDGTIAKSGELGGKVGKHIAKKLNDNGCNVSEETFEKVGNAATKTVVGGTIGLGASSLLIGGLAASGAVGASVTTSGLAALGGGSIASGGLGMAGGIAISGAIVTASANAAKNAEDLDKPDVTEKTS